MGNLCLKNNEDVEFLKESFNILSEPNRIKILCLLEKNGATCVCEIVKFLDLKQNLVSHHLWMFKRIWIIESKRDWTKIYYKINQEIFEKLKKLIWNLFNF